MKHLDVRLPGTSGLELAQALRHRHPGLPVVVTTGFSERIEREGEGDFRLIRKPYSIDDLTTTLVDAARQRESV